MYNSLEGLELSAVSKRKTQGTAAFDLLQDDDDVFSDYDCCFDLKDDELNIEQDYLHKLKIQRERMEKLSKNYHEKEQQLERQITKNGQFLCQIERLTQYLPFKERFDDLKHNYDELLLKYQMTQCELADVKEELAQVVYQNNQTINRLKVDFKNCKQTSTININQLQELICDKDDDLKNIKREWKDSEDSMSDDIKILKNTINKMKNELDNEGKMHQNDRDKWAYEIKARDGTILEYEKVLENMKRQNVDLKNDVIKFSEEIHNREQELSSICNKFKNQLNQAKKTIHEKENMLQETQNELKKVHSLNYELQGEMQQIRIDFKKSCELYESSHKKLKHDGDSEIMRLEGFVKELKESIEELMEVKNHLIAQNRKLTAILRKKQQNERHRKQILKTQLKQIDRIEKVIDKIH